MGVLVQVLSNEMEHLKKIGTLFYAVNPYEYMFKDVSDIPKTDVFAQAMPYFFGFVIIEHIILKLKGKRGVRLNDGIMSFANGIIMLMMQMFVKGFLMMAYFHIYNNWRIYELPWDSTITWIVAAILCDLGYYWVHRAAHELNILWAAHQVHHSSEDYNLTTALRQSAFQGFGSWPLYLPMAFFVPPAQAVIHKELNLLYQFWIHTELVQSIGPLEWVLNTASHHRVHHGANRYCLDKNYAGVLIIWDRMFGTFEAERSDVDIVYGLVDQPQFWNPIKHQVFYYGKVVEKAFTMGSWSEFFTAILAGPGWFPGTGRLGDITFVEERPKREKFETSVPVSLHIYTILHFGLQFLVTNFIGFASKTKLLPYSSVVGLILYNLWGLTNIGLLYDRSALSWPSEAARCLLTLLLFSKLSLAYTVSSSAIQLVFMSSAVLSLLMSGYRLTKLTKNPVKQQ